MTAAASTADLVDRLGNVPCKHRWEIGPADGSVSLGVCQNCGTVRQFNNFVESFGLGDERPRGGLTPDVARVLAGRREDGEEE